MQTSNGIFGNKWARLAAGSALLLNVAGAQPQYTAVDIGSLGGSSTTANGINNSGQVVGLSYLSDNATYHAFLYSACGMTDLGALNDPANNSVAFAISDNGQVVGLESFACTDTNSSIINNCAFRYINGTIECLSHLSKEGCTESSWTTTAYAVNNSGQIVGDSAGCGWGQAFLYSDGLMTIFEVLDPYWENYDSTAYGINSNGWIAGVCLVEVEPANNRPHAFLTKGTDSIDLGTLGDPTGVSQANAINANGQVVGSATLTDDDYPGHAFVYSGNGPMMDLGTLGESSSAADAINNNSQIVGWSGSGYAPGRAFLCTFVCTNWVTNGPGSSNCSAGTWMMVDLNSLVDTNSLGTYLTEARGINDSGQIAANGADGHAYLLTPASQVTPPAPAPPAFLSITLTNGMVSFTWSTVPCYTYQVQYCSNLSSASWNDLGSPVTATGTTLSATDAITAPQRFYRILAQ